ncbi:MAG TPA: tripartite tricarboxylate transporter substrate binding protein [Pelagibacterium sp.]|nr:tripartite tricarboxylate transporter substrate binding protein [Pelagibacterium sp.]|tara:strand:- start:8076 stop:9029 length:954 start_codon:yes stop_codon:yes gene_type:complete
MSKISLFAAAGSAALALMASTTVFAQDYPERDVTLVVQSSAGGGSDIFARAISSQLTELELIERTLLVENRPGGSGTIAYAYTAGQAGNPYVLQTIASSFFTTPLLGQSPVGPADFTPLAAIAADPYVLAVDADSDFQTLADLVAAGSATAGTTGVVNDQTILSSLLGQEAGIDIRNVPFDGSGEEMSAVLGGHVDLIFGNPSEIIQQVEAGELRALAVSTGERLETLPDVPTFTEEGYNIEHVQLRALVMPGDVEQEAVDYWVERLEALATSDLWRETYVNRYNLQNVFVSGDELQALFDETSNAFEELMAEAGLI